MDEQLQKSMWVKGRHSIVCLPKATAVCGSFRPRVFTPVPQGRSITSKEETEFLHWLRARGEVEARSSVTVGTSLHGRGLFALRPIQEGERILKISKNLIITPDKLHEELKSLLHKGISNCARLALVILAEQHAGQASEWAPYITSLPQLGALHNTVLWTDVELEMIHQSSSVYCQTLQFRASILEEFAAIQHVFQHCPHIFGQNVTLRDFRHAYALVNSRAWGVGPENTVGLVPFVDFLNHDPHSQSFLSFDNEYEYAEVIADRDYAPGEHICINYGRFGNDVLSVTFGFTLEYNPFDQVEVWMGLSERDVLHKAKLELLQSHGMLTLSGIGDGDGGGNVFLIKEVKSVKGRGKGIPQSLRAFARVLCANSSKELVDMAREASELDGRLARRPLKNMHKELQTMVLLLARIESIMQDHTTAILALQVAESCRINRNSVASLRREMAEAILGGELRVLNAAVEWLKHHCKELNYRL